MLKNNIEIFLKKKKNKKRQYNYQKYRNLSEDEKQTLVQYGKKMFQNAKVNKGKLILL